MERISLNKRMSKTLEDSIENENETEHGIQSENEPEVEAWAIPSPLYALILLMFLSFLLWDYMNVLKMKNSD